MSVRIVGIGASAGGLQALESFFSELPVDLGVAYVVVQHLSLDHASSMTTILQRATSLQVKSLNKLVIPEPNTVYVKMPEVDVEVDSFTLRTRLRATDPDTLYLPIDKLFFSLAKSRGEDAIAIILSGMGTDGSRGLKEIKSHGGLVLVQRPDSAQFDGMPRAALRQRLADVVLPPAELAARLAKILRNAAVIEKGNSSLEELSQTDLVRTLLDRIQHPARVDFNRYRPATIMRRIEKRMLIRQFTKLIDYVNFTSEDEEERQILRQSFLIGVTRFFRDREAFDVLGQEVIPTLFREVKDREVRIWVPACSTGEEAYSIAMMMQEYLDDHDLDRTFKIFGSDVDRKSIIAAAAGKYDEAIAADIPPGWLQRYFHREPPGYRVRADLKENILFAVQNLLDDPPFIRIDFLSCRNFLIYINGEAQQRILSNFHFSLNPSGYLLLGPSESLGVLQSAFTTIDRRWKLYQKRLGGRTSTGKLVSPVIDDIANRPGKKITIITPDIENGEPDGSPANPPLPYSAPLRSMDYYARYLSERYAPATLFVNKQYDILYLNGDFSGMLRLPRFNAMLSLHTMVSEEAESLLTAGVDRVLRTGNSGIFERINVGQTDDEPRYVRVRFSATEFVQLDEAVAVLEFFPAEDETKQPNQPSSEEVYSVDRRLKERIRKLEAELLSSEQRGQKLYNELEATNEELQSSNRELLASNEEMQSTNEELQSVNEELYTVNNEFQRKNEELNNINNDVNNLLKSTQISTIFVDSQLRIRRFTPGVGQQFDLHSSDLGRPITSFANPFEDLPIEKLCRNVLETNMRHDEEIEDNKGNYFLLRMLPYLTEQDEVEGIVITFVDINDLVRTRRRLTDMAHKYEAIFENTEETIAIMRENSRIEEINRSFAGRGTSDLIKGYFTDLIATDQDKVKFNESLRASFDNGEVSNLEISLITMGNSTMYTKLEVIPIVNSDDGDVRESSVEQAMVIIHDYTTIEKERKETSAVISQYAEALYQLQQDAGLLDLEERMVNVNHMRGHMYAPDHYKDKYLSDFVSPEGMEKYRTAVKKIKAGSPFERVDFTLEELTDDNQARSVIYRPVHLNGELSLISFETINHDGMRTDD